MRFLVTAGSTREAIDQVRQWSNIFTGNTGLLIARALLRIGPVDLLTSNAQHLAELKDSGRDSGITATGFQSHAELKGALAALMARRKYDAVFMTAAVSDYRPAGAFAVLERRADGGQERWVVQDVGAAKVKSAYPQIAILGEKTEKLIDLFRSQWGYRGLLVKFKLEVGIGKEELLRIGQESRRASGADYLVANTLDMVSGENPGAYLLSDAGHEWVSRGELPERMARLATRA